MSNELKALHDDDRQIRVEQSQNGELAIYVGNQVPVFVAAEEFRAVVNREVEMALDGDPAIEWGYRTRDGVEIRKDTEDEARRNAGFLTESTLLRRTVGPWELVDEAEQS